MAEYLALPEPIIEGQVVRREIITLIPCLGLGCIFIAVPAVAGILFLAEQNNFHLSDYINAPCAIGIGAIMGLSVAVIAFGASLQKRWIDA